MTVKSILISQPQPTGERSPFFDLAEKYDIKIDFRHFIQVEGVSGKDFRKDKISILDHNAVIITSRTAVDHYFRICKELRIEVPEDMKYFCTSEAVALYLQKYITYRKRKIFYGNKSYDDLISVMQKHKSDNFLLPISEAHNVDLPDVLDLNKIKYTKAVIYKTVSSDLSDLKDVNYDVLVFFSPLGITSLFENFPDFVQNNTRIATFGKTTYDAAIAANIRVDIKVPTVEAPSMIMALENYIKQHNK